MTRDKRYMSLAATVATWAKDPSTKIGAVAVDPTTGNILSLGYNGFPRGIEDSEQRLNDRPTKYKFIVHAEANLIYNATLNGVSLNGATVYISGGLPPCSECAKAMIQVGVKRIVTPWVVIKPSWVESCKFARELLDEAGVILEGI